MKTIDFSFIGGFPLDQRTLNDKQSAYLDILYALTGYLRVPATGSHIMYGCELVAGAITPGMMYIDGELCTFAGSAGDATTKIKKSIIVDNAPFFGGINNPVYKNSIAEIHATGVAYSDFTRFGSKLVYDGNYIHIDNNFTNQLLAKLNGIEALAQKNVKTDWNENNPASDAFLINRPTDFLRRLTKGTLIIGNVNDGVNNGLIPVNFQAPLSTTNYIVVGTIHGMSVANQHLDDHLTWVARDKTLNSFRLSLREFGNITQNIRFDYSIFSLD